MARLHWVLRLIYIVAGVSFCVSVSIPSLRANSIVVFFSSVAFLLVCLVIALARFIIRCVVGILRLFIRCTKYTVQICYKPILILPRIASFVIILLYLPLLIKYRQDSQNLVAIIGAAILVTLLPWLWVKVKISLRQRSDSMAHNQSQQDQSDSRSAKAKHGSKTTPKPFDPNIPIYRPIPTSTSIRTLRLEPGSDYDPIVCSMRFADVNAAPSYEALSYVWGDKNVRQNVILHDRNFPVTTNLKDALQNIRRPDRSRLIWVDAICINQDDSDEKDVQIRLMSSVYRNASRVLAWLGPKDEDAAKAYKIFASNGQIAQFRVEAEALIDDAVGEDDPKAKDFLRRREEFNDSLDYRGLKAFFEKRPWFRRVWIAQEIGLSREALLLCGDLSISWKEVVRTLQDLGNPRRIHDLTEMKYIFISKQAWTTYSVFESHRRGTSPVTSAEEDTKLRRQMDFVDVMECAWYREATDEKDYIYAFLGHPTAIVRGKLIIEPETAKSIKFGNVYARFVGNAIRATNSLRILSHVSHNFYGTFPPESIPTWVPRWNEENDISGLGRLSSSWYGASGNVSPEFDVSSTMLSLSGIQFDKVMFMSKVRTGFTYSLELLEPGHLEDDVFEGSWQFARLHPLSMLSWFSPYGPKDKQLDAFALTLTAGSVGDGITSSGRVSDMGQFRRDFWQYRALAFSASQALGPEHREDLGWTRRVEGLNLGRDEEIIEGKLAELAEGGDYDRFMWKANQRCHGRRFFVTRKGYFGIGPECMERGDIIAVLFGGKVPYVLRATDGGRYFFIGECYVHGIMSGEVIEKWRIGKFKKQTFDMI
ncbi:heterokaryon incompatibility protein-domain-containing protein [Dactylonectria macrodidyma]|uniref:Heterokaryon incompatibility protein-domain-containing protein n=1 Tax=Dactylonectria macrodidyma TaxID=307937 RepID=A0A9P9J3T2_9HYPO|nr:heterokaryon incompatibility protein-domain-containing protein [Dactylonectria macrodidyma]